jgi:hypothetical protein
MVKRRWLDRLLEAARIAGYIAVFGALLGWGFHIYHRFLITETKACEAATMCKENKEDIVALQSTLKKIDNNVERILNHFIK